MIIVFYLVFFFFVFFFGFFIWFIVVVFCYFCRFRMFFFKQSRMPRGVVLLSRGVPRQPGMLGACVGGRCVWVRSGGSRRFLGWLRGRIRIKYTSRGPRGYVMWGDTVRLDRCQWVVQGAEFVPPLGMHTPCVFSGVACFLGVFRGAFVVVFH